MTRKSPNEVFEAAAKIARENDYLVVELRLTDASKTVIDVTHTYKTPIAPRDD